jgi:putative inorganic carbon (HCO3(-)) transporter
LRMVAHSTWLGVLAETGIPGLVTFVVLVVATVCTALRSRRALYLRPDGDVMRPFASGLVAALAGFCVASSFLTHGFTWPLYTLVGLSVALSRYAAAPAPAAVTMNRTIAAMAHTPASVRADSGSAHLLGTQRT